MDSSNAQHSKGYKERIKKELGCQSSQIKNKRNRRDKIHILPGVFTESDLMTLKSFLSRTTTSSEEYFLKEFKKFEDNESVSFESRLQQIHDRIRDEKEERKKIKTDLLELRSLIKRINGDE